MARRFARSDEGISRAGTALFPMMGYERFQHMSDEDVYSLVAYLNTLTPVRNPVPRSKIVFPVSMLMKRAPQPAGHVPAPDRSNKVKYGDYLVTLAGRLECHTPARQGKPLQGMTLAGGQEFRFPGVVVVSANITTDLQTGIGSWSEQNFLDRVYQYKEVRGERFAAGGAGELHRNTLAQLCPARARGSEGDLCVLADATTCLPRGGFPSRVASEARGFRCA